MVNKNDGLVKEVDVSELADKSFNRRAVGCIILSKNHEIILQQRPEYWRTFPGCLATFGGGIEAGETPIEALVRELKEELGAEVDPKDVVQLGVITEATTNHKELIYVYFWQDRQETITGCYECEARYYDSIEDACSHPKMMQDVQWALKKCVAQKLLSEKLSAPNA